MSELTLGEAATTYQEQAQAAVGDSMKLTTADAFPDPRSVDRSQFLTTLSTRRFARAAYEPAVGRPSVRRPRRRDWRRADDCFAISGALRSGVSYGDDGGANAMIGGLSQSHKCGHCRRRQCRCWGLIGDDPCRPQSRRGELRARSFARGRHHNAGPASWSVR